MRPSPLMVLICFTLSACDPPPPPAPAESKPPPVPPTVPPEFDIRSPDGSVIVPAVDILEYEWARHVMRWRPGVKDRVLGQRVGDLVEGSPFQVCVNGVPVYDGKFTSSFSSNSLDAVVIRDFRVLSEGVSIQDIDEAHLELGYGFPPRFTGPDPRGSEQIRQALEEAGKLR